MIHSFKITTMLKEYRFICKQLMEGKSVSRSFLNYRIRDQILTGKIVDIGGGKDDNYLSFVRKDKDATFVTFDVKAGHTIDFEKDTLPFRDSIADTVLFLNVMEHIFNHQHIANEVMRILKPDGKLVGYVPFLMWYHPDHSDFFRYTHEAIELIFKKAGATEVIVQPVSKGPFMAALHMILPSIPKILRVPTYTLFALLDSIFLKLRPGNGDRYALGYYFECKYSEQMYV